MVTSFLLMASDQTSNHEDQQQQQHMSIPLILGSSEETKNTEPVGSRIRGRKGSVKGPKKQPQRGLGVEQLERLRIQECWKKMSESSSGMVPTTFPDHHQLHNHHNLLQCHPQMLPFPVHDPFGSNSSTNCGGGVLVRCGAGGAPPPNNVQVGFQCPQHHQVIHGTGAGTVITGQGPSFMGNNNKSGFVLGSSGVGTFMVPNQMNKAGSCGSAVAPPLWTPLEASRVELSSMPNVHSQSHHESFDVCIKKTRFNEDNMKGSNARNEKPLDLWPNGSGFQGYSLQTGAPNLDGEASYHFCNKPAADATHSGDEGVEVVAVHRKGNSVSGRVFMEYEFFPGKDATGTASKELESPTFGSVDAVGGGEASSIITATTFRKTACNCNNVDLSLKLSR